ncbi:hypothetical protein KO486_12720 [Octadecabacter sp. B2R22]|nr:hypothetical protein [Octadecabacter sp. B2R22]
MAVAYFINPDHDGNALGPDLPPRAQVGINITKAARDTLLGQYIEQVLGNPAQSGLGDEKDRSFGLQSRPPQ